MAVLEVGWFERPADSEPNDEIGQAAEVDLCAAHERRPPHVRQAHAEARVTERLTPPEFLGAWRIETMELWARNAIDLQGKDERDDASGRGWAVIDQGGTLTGRLYFHQGDDSAFTARRTDGGRPRRGA